MKQNEVYVVHAVRYGNIERHSYIAGVFNKKHAAFTFADEHVLYRGGIYECRVEVCNLNQIGQDVEYYSKVIYTSKSSH